MSRGILHKAVRNVSVSLAIMTVLSTATYAADPNAPAQGEDKNVGSKEAKNEETRNVLPSHAPTFLPSSSSAAPSRQIRPVRPPVRTPASFTPQMPLSEAIDILRNCTTPPLNLIVLWRDLDNAGIYRDTPIGIDGIPGLRIGQYLDLLVASLSAGGSAKIGYAVHQGVITVATTTGLPAPKHITRVYDIRDLTAPPANSLPQMGYGGMYGGQMTGLAGGYGGGLGAGYGMGSSYLPGGSGLNGAGGLSGLLGNSYGSTRVGAGAFRGR